MKRIVPIRRTYPLVNRIFLSFNVYQSFDLIIAEVHFVYRSLIESIFITSSSTGDLENAGIIFTLPSSDTGA